MDKRNLLFEIEDDQKYSGNHTYFYISGEKAISYSTDWDLCGQWEALEICRYDEKPPLFDRCEEWLLNYLSDDANLIERDDSERISAGILMAICVDDDDLEEVITDSEVMHRRYLSLFDDCQNTFATGDVPLILAYLLPGKQWPEPVREYLRAQGIDAGEVPERTRTLLDRAQPNLSVTPCGKLYFGAYPAARAEDNAFLRNPDDSDSIVNGFKSAPVSWTAFPNGNEVDLISDCIIDMMPFPDGQEPDSYISDVYLNRSVQSRLFSEAEKQLLISGSDIVLEQPPNYFDSEGNVIEELFSPEVLKGYLTQPSRSNVKYYLRQRSMVPPVATDFAVAAGTTLKNDRIATITDAFVLPDDVPMCGIRPMIRMSWSTFAELSRTGGETAGKPKKEDLQ